MKKQGKYFYWKSKKTGKWYFHFKNANGKITDPSQGYKTKSGALKAIERDKRDRSGAEVLEKIIK
jgi:uncharacterized protein YegP (UPF0339 family)